MTPELPRIWIITDPSHPDGPVAPIRRALEGCPLGVVGVQLRAKQASDRQLVQWGRELRTVTHACRGALTVNRRVDVAQIVGADGVHLPELGLPIADVREAWPTFGMLGVSRHDAAGLEAGEQDSASYAFLSRVLEPCLQCPRQSPAHRHPWLWDRDRRCRDSDIRARRNRRPGL
ncbi:MAG: thiamine phosphate synthase [Deltaproteobacteria bacterium]|nr:thiamine phosphate synthase [Deltaproteobacteria bacterium]